MAEHKGGHPLRVLVSPDKKGWHEHFVKSLNALVDAGMPVECDMASIDCHDWLEVVAPYDAVVRFGWIAQPREAAHQIEKTYVLERLLGKLAFPNLATVWHYESKIAQSYLFRLACAPTPRTFVSFDLGDADRALRQESLPLVFKRSHGAGGRNVRRATTKTQCRRELERSFCHAIWTSSLQRTHSTCRTLMAHLSSSWAWEHLKNRRLAGEPRPGAIYWQEYVADNPCDLRIVTIGDRYAYGFWRLNRPGDFRASGSGLRDFERPVPQEVVEYCLRFSRQYGFDSMAYDVLFRGDEFLLVEMSFQYVTREIAGYFDADPDGRATLSRVEGLDRSEHLLAKWFIHRIADWTESRAAEDTSFHCLRPAQVGPHVARVQTNRGGG